MDDRSDSAQIIRFGLFEADVQGGELRKNGFKVPLHGQPFQVFAILLQHSGKVVSREELCEKVWPDGTFVDFNQGLSTAIAKIRTALGDSAENPRFVETVPRRGYRFIAPVDSPPEPTMLSVQLIEPVNSPYQPSRAPVPGLRRRWAIVAVLVGIATLAATSYLYFHHVPELTNFGTFDAAGAGKAAGQGTSPTFINQNGVIAGSYLDAKGEFNGFVFYPNVAILKIDIPGTCTGGPAADCFANQVYGIDLKGMIAGEYQDASFVYHGFVRDAHSVITTFDVSGAGTRAGQGSGTFCMNPEGAIAGSYTDVNNVFHGFVRYPNGVISTFDAPGGGTGTYQGTYMAADGNCINSAGTIVGFTYDAVYNIHGFERYSNGSFTTFDAPGAGTTPGKHNLTLPTAINQEGAIVGNYADANRMNHGFLRHPDGSFTTIDARGAGTAANQGTYLCCINQAGAIVGNYADANRVNHGFLRRPDGSFTTIDVPGVGKAAGQGTVPTAINQNGAITGYYTDANGAMHGFVLRL